MPTEDEFLEGDIVRVTRGAFTSFVGKVLRVDNESKRMTVEGHFEFEPDSNRHLVNVSFEVVEKSSDGKSS